jgi:hypothetical protein
MSTNRPERAHQGFVSSFSGASKEPLLEWSTKAMQKPLCGFTAHLLDFSTRPEQSLEFSEAAVKDLFEDVDKSSSSIQI